MLLVSKMVIQGIIVLAVVLLFVVTFILNKKTKAPKGVDLPEKCEMCQSNTCIVKMNDIDKIKEEMKEYINKECGDENEEK